MPAACVSNLLKSLLCGGVVLRPPPPRKVFNPDYTITNGVYLGSFPVLKFTGTFTWVEEKARLEFTFDQVLLFTYMHPPAPPGGRRGMARGLPDCRESTPQPAIETSMHQPLIGGGLRFIITPEYTMVGFSIIGTFFQLGRARLSFTFDQVDTSATRPLCSPRSTRRGR